MTALDDAESAIRRARDATTDGERLAHVLFAAATLGTWLREREEATALARTLAASLVRVRRASNDGRRRR